MVSSSMAMPNSMASSMAGLASRQRGWAAFLFSQSESSPMPMDNTISPSPQDSSKWRCAIVSVTSATHPGNKQPRRRSADAQ
jgi:hypothetical protein